MRKIWAFAAVLAASAMTTNTLVAQIEPEIGIWSEGACSALSVQNDIAYYANGWWIEVADVSDPSDPQPLGRINLGTNIYEIEAAGEALYVRLPSGLQIIDVSAPSTPELGMELPGFARALDLVDDRLFVGTFGGITLYDISDPLNPVEEADFDLGAAGSTISYVEPYLYVEAGSNEVRIYDITDPLNPDSLTAFERSTVNDLAVLGDRLYVAGDSLYVLDITDRTAPVQVYSERMFSWTAEVWDGWLFTYDPNATIRSYDLSDPDNPTMSDLWFQELTGTVSYGGSGQATFTDGVVYIADKEVGFGILDIGDPTDIMQLGLVRSAGLFRGLEVVGDEAILSAGANGITVLDISATDDPVVVDRFSGIEGTRSTQTMGAYIFVAGEKTAVLSRSGSEWTIEAELPFSSNQVLVDDTHAYFVRSVLHVVSIADPASPTKIAQVGDFSFSRDATKRGDLLYVAAYNDGVIVFDVSDPENPVEAARIEAEGGAQSLYFDGDTLVIGTGGGDVQFVDVSDLSNPVVLRTVDRSGFNGFLRANGYLFGLRSGAGLHVLDETASPPNFDALSPVPFDANTLVHEENRLFALSSETGVRVFTLEGVETARLVDQAPADRRVMTVYPNPFQESVILRLEGTSGGNHHRITVVDMMGRTVQVLHEGEINGTATLRWNGKDHAGADAAPGIYMIRSETDARVMSQGVVKVR